MPSWPRFLGQRSSHERVRNSDDSPSRALQTAVAQIPETRYDPSVDAMASSILSHLCNHMRDGLPPSFNSQVFRVLESRQIMIGEAQQLRKLLEEAVEKQHQLQKQVQDANRKWALHEEGYIAEIKRLEQVSVEGKSGDDELQQVTKQNILRYRSPIFSRSESALAMFNSQESFSANKENITPRSKATAPARKPNTAPTSPSARMRKISQKILSKTIPNVFSVGTPPKTSMLRPPRSDTSGRDSDDTSVSRMIVPRAGSRLSEDTYSSFDSYGDELPDEITGASNVTIVHADDNAPHIRILAEAMEKQRGVKLEAAINAIADLVFGIERIRSNTGVSKPGDVSRVQHGSGQPAPFKELTTGQKIVEWENRAAPLSTYSNNLVKTQTAPSSSPRPALGERTTRNFSFQEGEDRIDVVSMSKAQAGGKVVRRNSASSQTLSTALAQSPFRNFSGTVHHPSPPQFSKGKSSALTRHSDSAGVAPGTAERETSASSLITIIHRSPVQAKTLDTSVEEDILDNSS